MNVNYYSYQELEAAALERGTAEDLAALGEWFENYGNDYWNGEAWKIDSSRSLYPIDECTDEENETWERTGYEIR